MPKTPDHWIKTPGRVSEMTRTTGNNAVYAWRADGRARLWVHRHLPSISGRSVMRRDVGGYRYRFEADRGPGGGEIVLPSTCRSDPMKAMAAVDKILFRSAAHAMLSSR